LLTVMERAEELIKKVLHIFIYLSIYVICLKIK
jgi:hypothetical protein